MAARFPHAVVAQGYGMTETAVAISGPDRRRPTPPGSVGKPMAGTEVKLVDGELWVRGPQVMAGYLEVEAEPRTTAGSRPATWPASTPTAPSSSSTASRN